MKDNDFVRNEELIEYKHGGKREGAGRPALGITKKVSITLPDEVWKKIDETRGEESLSAFLRKKLLINGERI